MTNVDMNTGAFSKWDGVIFEAKQAVLAAATAEERATAQEKLTQLKYAQNAERYPIRTELRDGKHHIVVPDELSSVRFVNEDMEIFVKRALTFRAMSGF